MNENGSDTDNAALARSALRRLRRRPVDNETTGGEPETSGAFGRDYISSLIQPKIEAKLRCAYADLQTEDEASAITSVINQHDEEDVIEALVRMCRDRDRQIRYLARDF